MRNGAKFIGKFKGACIDEPFLRLDFKAPGDSLVYVKEYFPGIPISVIDTIEGIVTEIDAEGNAQKTTINPGRNPLG